MKTRTIDLLDEETRALVAPLLPRVAQEIADVIGLAAAIDLCVHFGGMDYRFSKGVNASGGAAKFEEVAAIVGEENARKLADAFAGEDVYIPRCYRAWLLLRARAMVADFDELTRTMSGRAACNKIARRYGVSVRHAEQTISGKERASRANKAKGNEK